jgi:hypothetical protein
VIRMIELPALVEHVLAKHAGAQPATAIDDM